MEEENLSESFQDCSEGPNEDFFENFEMEGLYEEVDDYIRDLHVDDIHDTLQTQDQYKNNKETVTSTSDVDIQDSDTCDSIVSIQRRESFELLRVRVMYYVENECTRTDKTEEKTLDRKETEEENIEHSVETGSGSGASVGQTCFISFSTFIWVILLILVWIFIG